jgi:hypothetical protein
MRKSLVLIVGLVLVAGATALAKTGSPDALDAAASVTSVTAKESTTTTRAKTEPVTEQDRPGPVRSDTKDSDVTTTTEKAGEPTTTTVEVDQTRPVLEILHPADGQVFERKEVVFEGVTEAGARVFAGEYEADVKDDGSWRIVLFLSPGTNHVTFRAKDASGNVTEASVEPVLKEPPLEEHTEWPFTAQQAYGECSEIPPYDVFSGTGKPGALIEVRSEFGSGSTEVNAEGHWELKITFPEAPFGVTFLVKVKSSTGQYAAFEFTRTG